MKLNKKALIFSLAAVSILGIGALGASAFWGDPENQGELAQKIAEKFNLNKDEVENVVNQFQEERRTQREAEMGIKQNERLSELVSEGKLTEAQKNALQAKWEEMRKNRPDPETMKNMRNLSDEERKAVMEERRAEMGKHREEMEQWMKSQGIDIETLGLGLGMGSGGKGGFGK